MFQVVEKVKVLILAVDLVANELHCAREGHRGPQRARRILATHPPVLFNRCTGAATGWALTRAKGYERMRRDLRRVVG